MAISAKPAIAEQHSQHLSTLLSQHVQALTSIQVFFMTNSSIYIGWSQQQEKPTEASLNFYIVCIKISPHGQLHMFRVG